MQRGLPLALALTLLPAPAALSAGGAATTSSTSGTAPAAGTATAQGTTASPSATAAPPAHHHRKAAVPKTAGKTNQAQRAAAAQATFLCQQNGHVYQSTQPCASANPYGNVSTWAGALGAEFYNYNYWILPDQTGAAAAPAGSLYGSRFGPPATPAGTRAVWIQDPGASGVGIPMTSQQRALPIQTPLSETPIPYAIILRDGTVLASVVPPQQSGNMVVGRDRTGRLYSIRATEVDRTATRLPAAAAAPQP
jgi:hypothetical protein